MLSHFKWYRKLRGGRWFRVTGLIWGHRWVRDPLSDGPPGWLLQIDRTIERLEKEEADALRDDRGA